MLSTKIINKDAFDFTHKECSQLNYDHPNVFDNDLSVLDIKRLKNNEIVHAPIYDFTLNNRFQTETIYPAKVILIEGVLDFENQELRDLTN
ncbi:hypothetical protein [Candidatus Chlamydia corallus]|uniref:hypothetical protein n=1 Tax=Candidatus Chlamydia corallus TaxID=2038470 RepID=UPI0023AA8CAC|nr:hypothetical protein [Candidatus Chlamydia corallus]